MMSPRVIFEDQNEYITIRKKNVFIRVKKLTTDQLRYLEHELIRPKLRQICEDDEREAAIILPQIIAKIVGCTEWPHYAGDLDFLWKLYQGGSTIFDSATSHYEQVPVYSDDTLKEVDCYILQAATLEILHTILENGLAEKPIAEKKSDEILAPQLAFNLTRYLKFTLPIDISCRIFSYLFPLELYFAMHRVDKTIRKSAYYELSKIINADIENNCNVYYTAALPQFKVNYHQLPVGSNCAGVGTYLFKSKFHALLASEKALTMTGLKGNDLTYQIIFKVLYPQKNDYDFEKEKKEHFIVLNRCEYSNYLQHTERAALVQYVEAKKRNFYILQVDVVRLNDRDAYNYYQFKSDIYNPFDPKKFNNLYLMYYDNQNNAAVGGIVRFKINTKKYRKIIKQESEIEENNTKNDEIIPESRPLDTLIEVKELALSSVKRNSQLIIYCDAYRRQRLLFFDTCADRNKQMLTNRETAKIEKSKEKSDELLKKMLCIYPKVL